jgi:hypothetical protein
MKSPQQPASRKKFLLLTAAAFCSASILRLVTRKRKNQADVVKLLAQDGTLVEVDKRLLGRSGRKISDRELQQWVKNNAEKN